MINIQNTVNEVVASLTTTITLETANPKLEKNKYLEDTKELQNQATFITDEGYFYFLSQYGDAILTIEDSSICIFGFGYWEGMAITDYPLLDSNGMYVLADYADDGAEMLFFAYNSNQKENPNRIWVSNDLESGFKPVYSDFLHLLKSISNGEFEQNKHQWLTPAK